MSSQEDASVLLSKGASANLVHLGKPATQFDLALGWKEKVFSGDDYDLDVMAVMLRAGRCPNLQHYVYYWNLNGPDDSLVHSGDDLTGGAAETDIEIIHVDTSKIPADIDRIVILVNIYDALNRKQNFGMVGNAFVRAVAGTRQLMRYDLTEDASTATLMKFGELVRDPRFPVRWKFTANSEPLYKRLSAVLRGFGLNVADEDED